MVTTYGMSETCGGCVYDGRPLAGVDVAGGPGEGPQHRWRRRCSPATGCGPTSPPTRLVDGRLLTSDRGRWRDGRLEILGRRDAIVITGGHNVDLEHVERTAAGLGVEIAILALPDPEWGSVVVAVTATALLLRRPAGLPRPRLPAYALPRRLVRLAALPRTSSGKIDRSRPPAA